MMRPTIAQAVANKEAVLALSSDPLYIDRDDPDVASLWPHVVEIKPGGSHPLDIPTDIWLVAHHPCGLVFRTTFEIEPYPASGSPDYHIDVEGCRRLLAALPPAMGAAFKAHLDTGIRKIMERADEYQRAADRQRDTARTLASI